MDSTSSPLLQATDLTQSFAETLAVDDLSVQVDRGEVLGLLGLNGAGKSSTLRMLAGVLEPDSGHITIDGISLQERPLKAKRQIGYLPEIAPLYTDMRVQDYLYFTGRLRCMRKPFIKARVEQLIQQLHLTEFKHRRIGNLSKGYKQRVGLAQALIHDPALLILDEPSSGLDPAQMREMRELIRALAQDKGVIFSSHLLGEVTELCDSVLVLHQGRQLYAGKLDSGTMDTGRQVVRFTQQIDSKVLQDLPAVKEVEFVASGSWVLTPEATTPGTGQPAQLLRSLLNAGLDIVEFRPERPSLEMLFSSLVGTESAPETVLESLERKTT